MIVVLVGVAVVITRRTEQILLERAQDSHQKLAVLGARQVAELFREIEKFLGGAAATLAAFGTDPRVERQTLANVADKLRDHGILEALRSRLDGTPLAAASGSLDELAALLRDAVSGCDPGLAADAACVSSPLWWSRNGPLAPVVVASVLVPATAELPPSRLAVVIDWRAVGEQIAKEVSITRGGSAWLVDDGATLLFAGAHAGDGPLATRSAPASCFACHASFEVAARMATGLAGLGELRVRGASPKLVAHAPLPVGSRRWSLAVSAPYEEVVATGRRNRYVVFGIKGVLVAALALLALYLDRQSREQLQAVRTSEASVRRMNEHLEAEVRQRTAEATAAFREANAVRAQYTSLERLAIVGELAAIVAHEVRTPLNALGLSSQRVARLLRAPDEAAVVRARELAQAQGFEIQRIDALVQEYLRLARLPRSGKARADLGELVRGAVRFVEVERHRSSIRFEVDIDPELGFVEVDADQMRQVALNLLVNAIQALPGGGEIAVRLRREGADVAFSVSDTGVGIAPEDVGSIFKPFFTTKPNGTGLGLSICARIVEEHHGAITVESTPGRGTTFYVRIPARFAAAVHVAGGG